MYFTYYYIILISVINVVYGCDRNVIWQNNFCPTTQPLVNNTILPPRSSFCRFYIDDSLSFINNNLTQYENVYQVNTEDEMMNCDASNPVNLNPLIVSGTSTLSLVTSSDFQFTVSKIVYLISTSLGSEQSALNDRTRNISCLQMSFHLILSSNKNCTLQSVCESSVLNDESIFDLGCNFGIFPQVYNTELTQTQIQTQTSTVTPTSTIRNELTNPVSMTSGMVSSPPSSTGETPSSNTQSIQCITFEYSIPEYFCLDWILFPLLFLILIVSLLIVFTCNIMCYMKRWLCFIYCRRHSIKDSDLYQPPCDHDQNRIIKLENVHTDQSTESKAESKSINKKFSGTTPLDRIGRAGINSESQASNIPTRASAPPPPFGSESLPPLRVKPIKVIGDSQDYQNN